MTIDFGVTRHQLTLGSQDSTTGWYAKSYTTSDIEMIIIQRGSPLRRNLPVGVSILEDAVGLSQDVVVEGDVVYNPTPSQYHELVTVTPHYFGDSFWFYESQLHELPYHGYSAPSVTPTTDDPRYRTKDYLETYIDDYLELSAVIIAYGFPDYPLTRVFNTKNIDLIYSIGEPNSTGSVDPVSEAIYMYNEHVPIVVAALDTETKWAGEDALRQIVKDNPTGSLRSLARRGDRDQRVGSTIIYMTEWMLNYRRDVT